MSFLLSNFLGGTSSTGDSSYSDENKQLIIEKLTTKMTNSAHLEDRKAAAQTIKSLARSHRLEIGTLALQALIDELRRDLEDEELAKIILETLDILCSSSVVNESDGEAQEKSTGIEKQFCEILLKDEGNVSLLLDLMGNSEDFYLRFTSIQILISLCNSQPLQLQNSVLNSPGGVEKVLDLLKDSREIVRNEGLLLCGVLVRGNSDLQKILAFQGAFEQVMKIIVEEEGPWNGPLIIQDAFNLISAMLNLNTSNQNYFRDSICFKQLAGLLALPQDDKDGGLWNRTRISNYLAALSVLDEILCKENVDLEASQVAAMRTHFQGPLLNLAFAPKIPLQVSASALNCLSGLIWSNNRAQQSFANEKLMQIPSTNCLMKIDTPISPLMAAILLAVHGNPTEESVGQRAKAVELFEAFCSGNSEGQLVLLSTLKASGPASPGTVILDALFDLDSSRKRDPWHCWYASILLCHLIDGNEEAKKVLLKHRIADPEDPDGEGEDLLTVLMLNMIRIATDSRGSTCQKSIIGYLQLLLIWFHESPSSIISFLSESSFLQYLLERITQQPQEVEIQGFAALIFGICVLYNDESVERVGSEALKGIIKNRIGPDLFVSRLSRLKANLDKNEVVCELSRMILLKNYESLMTLVVRPTPAGTKASHTATLAQLSKDLVESRALLASTHLHLSETSALVDKLKIGIAERDAYIAQLQKFITEKNQKIAQMAHEMSSHYEQQQQQQQTVEGSYEKCLADQEALKSLNETIKFFQETVARQQKRIEELEALLRETEEKDSELDKWKEAYHRLYEQVQQQLNFDESEVGTGESETSAFDYAAESNTVHEQSNLLTASEGVEVLSPSMFMSPLAESEPVIVEQDESTSNTSNTLSPELVSVNQIPEISNIPNEYPNLSEAVDTSFTAAVIVSEEYANNEPNPSEDEIVQNISSECPPDNFLASDPDEAVEIVSSEEIKNVLRFFDDLPDETPQIQTVNSTTDSVQELQGIQEGLEHLNFEAESSPIDQQVPDINDTFELPDEMEGDEFEHYAESNFDNIPREEEVIADEGHFGYAYEHSGEAEFIETEEQPQEHQEQPQEYQESSQEYQESSQEHQEPSQEYQYGEQPAECEHPQEYQYEQIQQQEQMYEKFDQPQEQSIEFPPEPQTSIDDYFSQEASHEFLQAYTEAGQVEDQNVYSVTDAEGYNGESSERYAQDYATTEGVTQEYTGEYDQNYNTGTTEYGQEYTTGNEGYSQDYIASNEGYDQNYATGSVEYTQDYTSGNTTQDETVPSESYNQVDAYAQDPSYSQSYSTEEYGNYAPEQYHQDYDYNQQYSTAQEYPSEYSVDQQDQSQAYSQEYVQEQDQEYVQEQDQGTYATQEQYDYNQGDQNATQDYQQEATTESSEYYYYDEATGYTYGFDQNVNQYYYYDPNTGEYVYYTAPAEAETQTEAIVDESVASSNPSLFDTAGPPMVALQQTSQLHESFVADPVYNL